MSQTVLLLVLFFHGVWGTFPPVSNPPPIPSQAVRNPDFSPPVGQYYISEDLPQAPPQPLVKSEGIFSSDTKPGEQRWYFQENQSGETVEIPSSNEGLDRFYGEYPNGEPAIGPVATPIPDDGFIAQSSSISNVNPNSPTNAGSDIWIVTRGSDNQYISERWLPVQVPTQQVVVSQDPNSPVATATVKSIAAPVSLPPDASGKAQFTAGPPTNIVQQIWVRSPSVAGSQKVITEPAAIVPNVPSVQQIVDIPAANVKQLVQQQVTKDAIPVPPPALAPVVSKKTFTVPPPLPPPVKGGDTTAAVLTSVPVPDSDVLISGKNGAMQQVRHIWVPTSSRTGRFITVPISNVNSGKPVINKGMPLNPTPIAMSNTWVLKQDGSVPSFEQQKSVVPPALVQDGNVIIQNPPVVQIDSFANPPVIAQVDVPSNMPTVGKTVSPPVDIWPTRKDGTISKVLNKAPIIPSPDISMPPPKYGPVIVSKSISVPPVAPVVHSKSIVANSKLVPPPPTPVFPISNGKPCPLPLPKSSLSPPNQNLSPVPRVIITRRQPLTRIIRVNRYPSGNYYLLNNGVRPNFYTYPNPTIIQQPKNGFVRLVQAKQFPIPVQSKQPIAPVQTKQISVPVQSRLVPSPVFLRKIPFPVPSRQVILPLSSPKPQTGVLYPSVQAIRYAYPWNGYLKASPLPGKRVLFPQFSTLKMASPNSASSSSESSSSESDSSESSDEDKKEKKVEKAQTSESEGKTKEPEKEPKTKPDEIEKEGEESSAETKSKESIEAAESQISPQTVQNPALLTPNDASKVESKPYIFGFDNRDKNGTVQHRQELSDVEGRVTGSYGYHNPDGIYRIANYVADSDGFRVNVESNEPGTVTHESAYANFISNKVTDIEKIQTEYEESTGTAINTDLQRD